MKTAVEAGMFNFETAIHDNVQARFASSLTNLII
jgi:hypothetical protein